MKGRKNLLPRNVLSKLLTVLGYAALLAKNLMLTEAPRRLLPLLAVSILAVATVTSPVFKSFTEAAYICHFRVSG